MQKRRVVVLGGLAVVAIAGVVAWFVFKRSNDREVAKIAAGMMACPADDVRIVSSSSSDAAEDYEVSGCGHAGTLHCAAPDFICFYVAR